MSKIKVLRTSHGTLYGILACLWSMVGLLLEPVQMTTECILRPSDLLVCAQQHGISHLPESSAGFGFGFGSVRDVDLMCRTKWHLKVYSCARKTVTTRCTHETIAQFRTRMWQFIFDTSRYTRAANYLCRAHNLGIFRKSQRACLLKYEKSVQNCSERYSAALSETILQLAVKGAPNATDEESYADHMIQELTKTYCIQLMEKIRCVSERLKTPCTQDAVSLIRNYYKESLSKECVKYLKLGLETEGAGTRSTKIAMQMKRTNASKSYRSQKHAPVRKEQYKVAARNSVEKRELSNPFSKNMLPLFCIMWNNLFYSGYAALHLPHVFR
ncbi:unnamed protein product [Dicrocoelium dendriticum]|nr:unnamed protein product [Dicrocoelium dendriticum]CAH8446079.1 unnamed protein product [Dicrocoelium dendriticum]